MAASDRGCGAVRLACLFGPFPRTYRVTDLGEHGFVVGAMAGCHDEGGTTKPQPTNGAKRHCPFCTGYASFQFAAVGSHTIVLPPQIVGGDVLAIEDDIALRKSVITPQSRGPPSLSA